MSLQDELLKRLEAARNFPDNTCAASRHTQEIGEALLNGEAFPMLAEEPAHCAGSLLSTVAALYETRTALSASQKECDALRRDAEWQPIETAPKDGTEIIGMYVHIATQIVHNVFWMGEDDTDENDVADIGWWTYDHSEVSRLKLEDWWTPTHWKPLPAPPDTAREQT